MSNQRTKTIESIHGPVEVEVVDCDSCGTTVRADATVPFTLGDREGVACENCYDDGPISFPDWRWTELIPTFHGMGTDEDGNDAWFLIGMFPLAAIIAAIVILFEDNDDIKAGAIGFAWACWGMILWGLLLAAVVMLA